MLQTIKSLRHSAFIRHNAIFFVGSLGVGFLNYLFYPVLGRLLPPGRFGEVQTLSSLFAQVIIFLSVFGLLTVNIVVNYEDAARRNRVVMELERLAALLGLLLLGLTFVSDKALQHFFNFASAWPFPILALAVLVTVPLTFRSSYLRGVRKFGLTSAVGLLGSAADLLLAALFVILGWGTTGAILGLVGGQLVALAVAAMLARRQGFSESWRASLVRLPDIQLIRPELRYALLVLVGSLGMTGLYSLDIIVIKHYFDAHTAGLYAGISTVARIVYFLTASIVGVLLPAIKLQSKPRDNHLVLLKSLALMTVVGGGALLVFALAPRFIVSLLMGPKYLPLSPLLPRLSLLMFVISFVNLIVFYFIALRRYSIALVVIIGVVVTYYLLRVHHQTLAVVIDNLLYGCLSMMLLIGIWLGRKNLNVKH
jgi:O-antigen/teichoic acid export membrane protein